MAAARGIHVTAAVEGEGEGAARGTNSADNSIAYQGAFDGKSQISLPSSMPTTRVALGARQYYWNSSQHAIQTWHTLELFTPNFTQSIAFFKSLVFNTEPECTVGRRCMERSRHITRAAVVKVNSAPVVAVVNFNTSACLGGDCGGQVAVFWGAEY